MKKISVIVFFLLASVFLFAGVSSAQNDLKAAAIKKFENAVARVLPADSNIVRVAVLDFQGDNGTIKNAITTAITSKTTFRVIERSDLDKILDEQGLQLKDIMDQSTAVKHGKIKGVQGLIMGRVLKMGKGFMSYDIKVHLKLDNVEKGEIVISKDIAVSAVSPVRNWIFAGVAAIIIIFGGVIMLKKRRTTVVETVVTEDVRARVDLTKEIGNAVRNISAAKAKLVDKGKTDEAVLLKDAERDLLLLREHVDNSARGNSDMRKTKEFKEGRAFDEKMMSSLERLTESTNKIFSIANSGNSGNLEKEVADLTSDIRSTLSEFGKRGF